MADTPAYTLVRSSRKTVSLSVTEEETVVVRAPYRVPRAELDRFVQEHTAWIAACVERRREYARLHPPLTAAEEQALRRAAAAYLPQRVAFWAQVMGVTPTGVRITSAKKRFGSCSGKNALCFSFRLMQYPTEAIEYVVVHELAHIRHHDHSAAFYRLVAEVMPDYRERAALLRR